MRLGTNTDGLIDFQVNTYTILKNILKGQFGLTNIQGINLENNKKYLISLIFELKSKSFKVSIESSTMPRKEFNTSDINGLMEALYVTIREDNK